MEKQRDNNKEENNSNTIGTNAHADIKRDTDKNLKKEVQEKLSEDQDTPPVDSKSGNSDKERIRLSMKPESAERII